MNTEIENGKAIEIRRRNKQILVHFSHEFPATNRLTGN